MRRFIVLTAATALAVTAFAGGAAAQDPVNLRVLVHQKANGRKLAREFRFVVQLRAQKTQSLIVLQSAKCHIEANAPPKIGRVLLL